MGLADFKGVRFSKNKDLASSYLDGCFGGIPILGQVTRRPGAGGRLRRSPLGAENGIWSVCLMWCYARAGKML